MVLVPAIATPSYSRCRDSEVSFQEFGRLFRDELKCRNALFLDGGSVPSLYVPSMKTGANFLRIGPMIGAFARARETPVP